MIGTSALKAFGGLAATVGVAGAGLGIVKLPPHATVPTTPPPAVSAPAPSGAAPSQGPIVIQTPAPAPPPTPGPVPQTKVIEHSAPIIVNAPPASPGGDVSSTNGPAINVNLANTNNNVQEQASTQEQDQKSSQAQTDTQTAPAPAPSPVVVKPKSSADLGKIKIEAGVKVGPVVAKPGPKQSPGGVGDVLKDINKALPCDPIRAIAGLC